MHVNPRCFITVDLLLKCITAGWVEHAGGKKRNIAANPHTKISLCVKWDLGLNVSGTHLWDGGTVEWPLNSKTALFIWSLIDGPVICTRGLPHHGNKSLDGAFVFFLFFPSPMQWHPRLVKRRPAYIY